jgi:hypothetical protein
MKKLLIVALLVGATSASFGQGLISWANTSSTLILLDPDGAAGGQPAVNLPVRAGAGTTYNFGLFLAPVGTAAPTGIDDANWQLVTAYALNSTAAAGAGRMLNPGNASSATYGPGTSVNFIVRAWQTQSGVADWSAAKTEGFLAIGTSSLGTLIVGGGAFPVPGAFGVATGQIGGFTVVPVPEPSSMALAGLGAAGLLLFRRRK